MHGPFRLLVVAVVALVAACATATTGRIDRLEHIVVIYAENRSFDHLYGFFPGAEGLAQATPEQRTQLDHDGRLLPHLPPVFDHGKPDPKFPQALPNGPFRITAPPASRRMEEVRASPIHAYYHHIEQINGGRNNMFVAMANIGAWVMGHFDGSQMKLWKWAQTYTLADFFFSSRRRHTRSDRDWSSDVCSSD